MHPCQIMGNCQPLPFPHGTTQTIHDGEDEDSVAASMPSSFFSCQDTTDLVATFASNAMANHHSRSPNKSKQHHSKSLLKTHRPDFVQRCIIEPDQVDRILAKQAEEINRRRRGRLFEHQHRPETTKDNTAATTTATTTKSSSTATTAEMMKALQATLSDETLFGGLQEVKSGEDVGGGKLDPFSDTGATSMVSGFTTASRSTIVTGNNRPASQFAVRKEKERIHRGQPVITGRGMALGGLSPVSEHKTPFRGNNANTTSENLQDLDAIGELTTSTASVLRLKMTARLGRFYSDRYLVMFPTGLQPRGAQSSPKRDDLPELVSDASSNSSESSRSGNSQFSEHDALPPTSSVRCAITDELFLDLAITGSLGLIPRSGRTRNGPSSPSSRGFLIKGNLKSPDHYIVLINRRNGIPLAVCAMKAAAGPPIVRIYATRQCVPGQRPAATTNQLGLEWAKDLPLFAWSEVESDGNFRNKMKFSIFMANGSEGCYEAKPSYEATLDGSSNHPVIEMVGRTETEVAFSDCALISIQADEQRDKRKNMDHELSFHLDLAQWIDPALMICFTAIVDEVIEKSIRTACNDLTQGRSEMASYVFLAKKSMSIPHYE